jgi:methylated-DNA-[protein]-cysteine S-methyltransferase
MLKPHAPQTQQSPAMADHHHPSALEERLMETPLGRLRLLADASGLVGALFDDQAVPARLRSTAPLNKTAPTASGRSEDTAETEDTAKALQCLQQAEVQLHAYFSSGGAATSFDLPLSPRGTPFQQAVWAALRDIAPGHTRSYGDIAAQVGRPSAVRAVGSAIGANPLLVIIPCHRVLGAHGQLTGFAAGLPRKHWLLVHEGALAPEPSLWHAASTGGQALSA